MRLEPAVREANKELAELKRRTNKEMRAKEKSYENLSASYVDRAKKLQETETKNLNSIRDENKLLISEENAKKVQTFHDLSDSIITIKDKLNKQKEAILNTSETEVEGLK